MEAHANGQVALLIDFENLVRGVPGDEAIDCEVLFRLSEEYGRVLLANAYADWRMKEVNQYQTDLYRLGAELVHVFGKGWGAGFKNAVDVKMAVDAIGTVSSLSHIDTFVIVSGDRDFIHVLKALRRHGKIVVGVSPEAAASEDFAALCDRFVKYEALATAYEPTAKLDASSTLHAAPLGLDKVRHALRSILENRPDGLVCAMIKPALRRELSPSFDESAYGFSRLTDLLRHLDDVVRLEASRDGSDMIARLAAADDSRPNPTSEASSISREIIRLSNLVHYRFHQDVQQRRTLLKRLFEAMTEKPTFQWDNVQQELLADASSFEAPISVTTLSRYKSMLFHGHAFSVEPGQEDRPQRERAMSLQSGIDTADAFIRLYEATAAYKCVVGTREKFSLTPTLLAEALGLPVDESASLEYCRSMLDSIDEQLESTGDVAEG